MPMTMLTRREVPAAIRAAVPVGRLREAVIATDQPVEVGTSDPAAWSPSRSCLRASSGRSPSRC